MDGNDSKENSLEAKRNTKQSKYSKPLSKHEMSLKKHKISFSADRATKRVVAPFVRVMRKGQKVPEVKPTEQFSFYLQKKPSVLMRNLSMFLSDSVELPSLLHETADVLKSVTKATDVALYMVDEAQEEIYQSIRGNNVVNQRHKVNYKIEEGKTVAAFVAYKKEYVMVEDVLGDPRFPEGVGYGGLSVKSVLCVPVVTPEDDCFAVIELYRDIRIAPFENDDLKIAIVVTGWMGAAIHQNQQRLALQKQQELNDYLLDLTKCYFADNVLMEKLITEIVSFAKVSLGAERGSFFIIDKDSDELVGDFFDEGITDVEQQMHKKNIKIRFAKDRGIAGLVARTGVAINVRDAYNDPRFNKEVDQKTGFITRSILCMPIMGLDGILGVVQVINKKNGPCFTNADENLFKTFSVYCALALHYARLHNMMSRNEKLNNIYNNMLRYHMRPCKHDLVTFETILEPSQLPDRFCDYDWYITPEWTEVMPQLVMYMIEETIGAANYEVQPMLEFVLTVQKSYRSNPYHNFEHAFNVLHCMFNIITRNCNLFSLTEVKALVISALCHDLDHKGYTNNFLQITSDHLAELYDESPLENHHYYVTMQILKGCNIFTDMTPLAFHAISNEIKEDILSTDLANYFRSRTKLLQISSDKSFDWNNVTHRTLIKSIMMTCSDLSGNCKPYIVAKRITDSLYDEFYNQGDVEKMMGLCPLSMMDREKTYMMPDNQVQFLSVVVLPCTELLSSIVPNTEDLTNLCESVKNTWKEFVDMRGKKVWRQEDSTPPEPVNKTNHPNSALSKTT